MRKKNVTLSYLSTFVIVCLAITIISCSTEESGVSGPDENNKASAADTILDVTYENGTANSGITGVTATHASAPDAAFMVQPGATGNYAIAHKVVYGNPGYFSAGAYRSEADAVSVPAFQFFPGQERRYEVSILLKDWPEWHGESHLNETNIFQLKISDNVGEPLRIMTKRNSIVSRRYNETQLNLVNDFRPYVNQWIHFRIDAKWATDNSGYIKIYVKLPGEQNYTLMEEQNNYNSWRGNQAVGNIGYIKWGVYGVPEGTTRIAYHDNIRIIKL